MDLIGNGHDTIRISRLEQIPQVKLTHDDIHSSCSICISNFTKNEYILILPCIHKFHRLCIQTWLAKNNTCPTCRERVFDDMDTVSNTDESSDDEVEVPEWSFELTDPSFNSSSLPFDTSDGSGMSESDGSETSDQLQSNVSWDDFFSGTLGMDAEGGTVSYDSSIAVSDGSSDETDSMNGSQITVSSSSSDSERSDASQIVLPVSSDDSSDSVEMQFDSTDSDNSD